MPGNTARWEACSVHQPTRLCRPCTETLSQEARVGLRPTAAPNNGGDLDRPAGQRRLSAMSSGYSGVGARHLHQQGRARFDGRGSSLSVGGHRGARAMGAPSSISFRWGFGRAGSFVVAVCVFGALCVCCVRVACALRVCGLRYSGSVITRTGFSCLFLVSLSPLIPETPATNHANPPRPPRKTPSQRPPKPPQTQHPLEKTTTHPLPRGSPPNFPTAPETAMGAAISFCFKS